MIASLTASFQSPPLLMVTNPVKVLAPGNAVMFRVPPVPVPTVVMPDTAKPWPAFNVLLLAILSVAQAAGVVIVTVKPPPMLTMSPATGKVPILTALTWLTVDHVVLRFQAVEALEKYVV